MSTTLYYFTGTGNSLYIAKTIASEQKDTILVPINQLNLSEKLYPKTDIVGIIYPTYFGDAPDVVKKFIAQLRITPQIYIFLYASYGAMLGNALYNLYAILEKRKIKVNAVFQVDLPDNSIIFPTKPEDQERMLNEGAETIKKHAKMIHAKTITQMPKVSYLNRLIGFGMKTLNHTYLGLDKIEINSNKCTNCGLCIKVCSNNNIETGKSQPIVGTDCSMCFSCIHYCPQQAVRFKRMKPKENYQYHNPKISLEEIIASRGSVKNF